MSEPLRIPPAINLKFDRLAAQVCDRARMDYLEWRINSDELLIHLQERWREGIQEHALNSEEAAERAIKLFGDPNTVARSLRKPWPIRLLAYQRFRSERFFVFVVSYFLFTWTLILDTRWQELVNRNVFIPFQILLPFGNDFFTAGIGAMFVGLAAVLAVVLSQWQPMHPRVWVNQLLQLRHLALLITGFAIFELAVDSVRLAIISLPAIAGRISVYGEIFYPYMIFHIIVILAGWLGTFCLLTEIFKDNRSYIRPVVLIAGILSSLVWPYLPASFALEGFHSKHLKPPEQIQKLHVDGYTTTGEQVEAWLEKKGWYDEHHDKELIGTEHKDNRLTVTWECASNYETFDYVYFAETNQWKFHDVHLHDMRGIHFDLDLSLIMNEPRKAEGFLILRNPQPLTTMQKQYLQIYFNGRSFKDTD